MVTDYDDIVERLTKRTEFQANLEKVFNKDELEREIKSSFDEDGRRRTLERQKDELFDTAEIKDNIVDNSVEIIEKSETAQELESNFNNISANLGDIGRVRELKIETAEAVRNRELLKEISPEDITAEQIKASPRKRVGKFASDFGLTKEQAIEVLKDAGAIVSEDEKTFRKPK